jgi:hypothetical protein
VELIVGFFNTSESGEVRDRLFANFGSIIKQTDKPDKFDEKIFK